MDDAFMCLDLDALCLGSDQKRIASGHKQTERDYDEETEDDEQGPALRGVSSARSSRSRRTGRRSESPRRSDRRSESPRRSDRRSESPRRSKDKKETNRQSSKGEESSKSTRASLGKGGGSFSIPFNLSMGSTKKNKPVTTQLDPPAKESSKDRDGDAGQTDSETDLEEYGRVNRNTKRNIKADVFMISGCEDGQTSADVSNVTSFSLPNPNGRAGGACTSALLKVLYSDDNSSASDLTFVQVLGKMRKVLRKGRYSQIPQLTSAHQMDVSQKFYIVPPKCTGQKRAVLIGINYEGQNGELSGCHNDCLNMKDYIMDVWGFEEENITVLMDDGEHYAPTRSNILSAYQQVVASSKSGDAVFCHYSGHGGRVRDDDWGEEDDGYDETLVPVDYSSAGQIRDDDLYTTLVCAMSSGVSLVSLMDCCHSGTVLDLPYKYRATGSNEYEFDPLALDGGNIWITGFLCAVVIIILVVMLPIMLTQN